MWPFKNKKIPEETPEGKPIAIPGEKLLIESVFQGERLYLIPPRNRGWKDMRHG